MGCSKNEVHKADKVHGVSCMSESWERRGSSHLSPVLQPILLLPCTDSIHYQSQEKQHKNFEKTVLKSLNSPTYSASLEVKRTSKSSKCWLGSSKAKYFLVFNLLAHGPEEGYGTNPLESGPGGSGPSVPLACWTGP